ncbi:uncharacterized protein N7483_002561 [Penicillium malachiteum]|uniref:uncharacterized protein n=1 Tax=Penicillium malachiteum TaxID=1324776 RepID=UPI002547E418|nr:uncharacterized protein N7483_002561 [Penicillium malachiteum]KAJ5737436.1 hypothetical protein N7483_002561 [Penicillium malachiteum]
MHGLKDFYQKRVHALLPDVTSHSSQDNSRPLLPEGPANRLWATIFHDDEWLQKASELGASPVLIAPDLDMIGGVSPTPRRHHVLLVTNDRLGNLKLPEELLFRSLRTGYTYNQTKSTITLPKMVFRTAGGQKIPVSELVLHIGQAMHPLNSITLRKKEIRRLFDPVALRTQFCFASEKRLRTVHASDIYGIGGKVSELGALVPICVLHLLCHGKRWPVILRTPKCPDLTPLSIEGIEHSIVGWKRP